MYAALHFVIAQENNFNEKITAKVHLYLLHAACITSQSPTSSSTGNLKLKPGNFRCFISFLTPRKANLDSLGCTVQIFYQKNLVYLV